jgi:Resolvase, N terminal domain
LKGGLSYNRRACLGSDYWNERRSIEKKWPAANNVKIVRWFEERGISGTKELTDRPALSDMMVALMSNGVHHVVVVSRRQYFAKLVLRQALRKARRPIRNRILVSIRNH